ncbi:MAG: hypothetical protein E6J34_00785 [Chloroflexi bacterium]|nr:MAG: hypothetical protein E6J34_00785 [Chloroflexota bacterium]
MADKNAKHEMSLSDLIKKHHHNGGEESTYEFTDRWITGVGEGDLSGIIITNSTFSGVNLANVTLTNARLTNVDFEGASSLTITCEESEEQSNPPSSTNRTSSSKKAVSDQQLSLFGTSSATVTVSVVASPVFDLSATMQSLRTLYTFDIIALIEESKKRIRDAQRKGSKYRPEQDRFRKDLLDGYNRQCAITKMDDEDILQAAHIIPFCLLEKVGAGQFGNSRWNGVLLRQELHTLFDKDTLTIAPLDGAVSLVSRYQGLSDHWEQFVLPPGSSEDPQTRAEHEQVWRSFLQWRFDEYKNYC